MDPISYAEKRRTEDVGQLSFWTNMLVAVSCGVALVPGVGLIAWVVGGPVCLMLVILAVVMMTKGAVGRGVGMLLLGLLPVPGWLAVMPLISTGVAGKIFDRQVNLAVTEEKERRAVNAWIHKELKAEDARVIAMGRRKGDSREVTIEGSGGLGGTVRHVYWVTFANGDVIAASELKKEWVR